MAADHWTADNWASLATIVGTSISVIATVVGAVISVRSSNRTRRKEAEARNHTLQEEARVRRLEAAKPFFQLRQELYMEALKAAGILANPKDRTPAELAAA